jgi:hypothetical protein
VPSQPSTAARSCRIRHPGGGQPFAQLLPVRAGGGPAVAVRERVAERHDPQRPVARCRGGGDLYRGHQAGRQDADQRQQQAAARGPSW